MTASRKRIAPRVLDSRLPPTVVATAVLLLSACGSDDEASSSGASDAGGGLDTGSSIEAGTAKDAGPDGALPACPQGYEHGIEQGRVTMADVTEASGLIASGKNDGVLWTHNDSGDTARVYAFASDGAPLASFNLNVPAADWEDMALGPGPVDGEDYLYLGDIGDNAEARASIQVHRISEPVVSGPSGESDVTDVESFTLVYPDRAHDAETLLVDPISGDLFIVTKERSDVTKVFVTRAPLAPGETTLEQLVELPFGTELGTNTLTTAGDVSRDGSLLIVKTYTTAFIWRRPPGAADLAEAFTAAEACSVPVEVEAQGEAIAFAADGSGYFTLSEGASQPLYFYAKR